MPANELPAPPVEIEATQALEKAPTYPLDDPQHPLHGWDNTITPVLAVLSIPLCLWRIGVFFERARSAFKKGVP